MVNNISPFSFLFSDAKPVSLIIIYLLKSLGGWNTASEQWDAWCYQQNYLTVLLFEDLERWSKDKNNKVIMKSSSNNTSIAIAAWECKSKHMSLAKIYKISKKNTLIYSKKKLCFLKKIDFSHGSFWST